MARPASDGHFLASQNTGSKSKANVHVVLETISSWENSAQAKQTELHLACDC